MTAAIVKTLMMKAVGKSRRSLVNMVVAVAADVAVVVVEAVVAVVVAMLVLVEAVVAVIAGVVAAVGAVVVVAGLNMAGAGTKMALIVATKANQGQSPKMRHAFRSFKSVMATNL